MMAIMQDGNSEEVPKEFLEGGRTGRRNALPDVLQPSDAQATTADLPARLQQLATTEGQTLSSTSLSSESNEYCDSDVLLHEFLDSECSSRRNAMCQFPCSGNKAVSTRHAESTSFPIPKSDQILQQFLISGRPIRGPSKKSDPPPDRPPDPPSDPPLEFLLDPQSDHNNVSTMVSDISWKYCCSDEMLSQFLRSKSAMRRSADPLIKPPPWVARNISTGVDPSDSQGLRMLVRQPKRLEVTPLCKEVGEIIQLDSATLLEMLKSRDPSHPQPGPSTQSEEKKEDAQKKEGS